MTGFKLGRIVATSPATAVFTNAEILEVVDRHATGDWGDIDTEDKAANEAALVNGSRLMSVYKNHGVVDETVWVITEADRSVTTTLLPSDY